MQRRGDAGQSVKGQGAARPKPRKASTATSPKAELQEQLDQRTRELEEALEQQAATSEVLRVISRSAFDLQAVFDTLVESAARLCRADRASIRLDRDGFFHHVANYGYTPEQHQYMNEHPIPAEPDRGSVVGRVLSAGKAVQIEDTKADPDFRMTNVPGFENVHTTLGVPLLREGKPIGMLVLMRGFVEAFTDKQIELVETFAAQAVIAIENTRLLNELRDSLQQQTATSDVLKVISSSPGELEPVFKTMLAKAVELCEANFGAMWLVDGEGYRTAAMYGDLPRSYVAQWRSGTLHLPKADIPMVRAIRSRKAVHTSDMRDEKAYLEGDPLAVSAADIGGIRTLVTVPMLKEGEAVGAIAIYRQEVRLFTEKQIELVKNFAAQAVIAIENTRLLNELRQRTDDLSESLEQQTATSEVLKVISSSPGDLQPVFDAILANATDLCDARFATLRLSEGDQLRTVNLYNAPAALVEHWRSTPLVRPHPESALGRAALTKQAVQIEDVKKGPAYSKGDPLVVAGADLGGYRTVLAVPMLKEDGLIGVISIYHQEVRPFTDKQIELVKNFAAQAVIAIENTRLLNELRESLQQQTATADVLKVISSSPGELMPVFQAMLAKATHLCEASYGGMWLCEGDAFRAASHHGDLPAEFVERWRSGTLFQPSPNLPMVRAIKARQPIQIADLRATEAYREGYPMAVVGVDVAGIRSMVAVPMFKENAPVGVMSIYRKEVRPFTDKHIELVTNFAAQAVIAIENARLLNELRESLQQQTATADVLKVISRSTFDLQAVLDTLVRSAGQLCDADSAAVHRPKDDAYPFIASYGYPAEFEQYMRENPVRPTQGSVLGRAVLEGKVVHVTDVLADPNYVLREQQKLGTYRTALGVPMLREGIPIGVLMLTRSRVLPFTSKQIELVETFADQAVIAIENARLLNELRESLQQQTATADVLKVISRSTFDLQTVLQTLVESAARLCDADKTMITREKNGTFYRAEAYGFSREFMDYVRDIPIKAERGSASGRTLLEGRVVHITDVKADPEYTWVEAERLGDFRTVLTVPMLREGVPTGVLGLARSEVRPFTHKQIELATTFADQAAIAIENVRLFESVEARTRELAKTLEDLRTTQDRLVQTQKLASLGQLTAGIAHEIKNPLNFVNNFSGVSVELIDELRQAFAGANLDSKLRAEISEIADTLQGNLDKVVQHGK
ncbi:MAG TPA: GAF domain-containing protein, partial [Pseudolabrys sp.]|nr:GAF domain-containing protein [Pseudolabrys sp.]